MDPCKLRSLPAYDDALQSVLAVCQSMPVELVMDDQALGRTLATPLCADRDQPPFDRSAMDGFAVHSDDIKAASILKVTGTVAAGGAPASYQTPVEHGCAYRIATGAPVPVGADAVIPIEYAHLQEGVSPTVRFTVEAVKPWKNVHRQGSDAKAGQTVIEAMTVLGPHHLAIAAATGHVQLPVYRLPRVVLLTTGDEVRPPDTPTAALEPQQIRNSNGPLVVALLSRLGITDVTHHHLPDEPQPTFDAAKQALNQADLVITVGGVSVGQRDHLPATWDKLGVTPILHGVAIQPGKPVFAAKKEHTLILGLPGNPVSVFATAHLFLWPVLCRMLHRPLPQWQSIALAQGTEAQKTRDRFRLVRTVDAKAHLITSQGSGDLMHTALAGGFARLLRSEKPCEAGQTVPFLPLIK
jgi:molybdopterin molybdotransferase